MKDKLALISALKQGNEEAFEKVFKHFYAALLFFSQRLLHNRALAEEVVQDVLFKLWQKRTDFESYEKIKAFLYISVKNASHDAMTSEGRKIAREQSYAGGQSEQTEAWDEQLIEAEFYLLVREAIDRLPAQCRKIIHMLFDEGKAPKQIAEELKISISTVNNQKARGIVLLRKQLNGSQMKLLLLLLS